MGQYNAGILTTAGQQLITQALAGDGIISFPLAKTSSWAIPAGTNIQALTDLQDIQQTVTPGTAQIFNGTMIQVQALFSNANQGSEVTEAYLVQTVGLWAQIAGGEPTLFSVYQATTPDQMPAYAGKAPSSLIYTLQATVQQASQLTVQVNPAGAATALDIQNLQTQITQIENDYIPKTQIGAASGVAGLGSNSAVPIAQGGTGGNTITEALANLGAQPGFNLLVNSRFKYNGRNQTSYTGAGFTVDGWSATTGQTVSVVSGGVQVTGGSYFQQIIKGNPSEKTITVSVQTIDGEIYTLSHTISKLSPGHAGFIGGPSIGGTASLCILFSYDDYGIGISVNSSQTVTLAAAKLELGSVSTLAADLEKGQDETIEQLRLDMYDLDPGRPAYILTQNENLLDNWYFVGGGSQQGGGQFPINQRGQTEYTGVGGTVDRWKSNSSSTLVSVVPDGISISVNNQPINTQRILNQLLESYSSLAGKTVTVSLALRVTSGSVNVRFYDGTKAYISRNSTSSDLSVISVSGTVSNSPTQMAIIVLNQTKNADFTLIAAKLELGPRSTLARLVDGEWVLNDPPPNFQQELAKCERYQKILSGIYCVVGWGIMTSSTQATVLISLPSGLRLISPTATLLGTLYLCTTGHLGDSGVTFTGSISNVSIIPSSNILFAALNGISGDVPAGTPIYVQIRDSSSRLEIDANL